MDTAIHINTRTDDQNLHADRARQHRQRNGCLAAVAFLGYLAILFTFAASEG